MVFTKSSRKRLLKNMLYKGMGRMSNVTRGLGTMYYKRPKLTLRRKNNQVPIEGGRKMISVPVNFPKKIKQGMKHCNTLVKKKLVLFKDALYKKANQIFYYRGVFKAFQLESYDNDTYQSGFLSIKTPATNPVCGGALGFGFYDNVYTTKEDINNNCTIQHGNVLVFNLDIATGYFNADIITGDIWDGTNRVKRQFGFVEGDTYFGIKPYTCFSTAELTTVNTNVAAANVLSSYKWQVMYTLSYKYTIEFCNMSPVDHYGIAVIVKLDKLQLADISTWGGLGNFINYWRNKDYQTIHTKLVKGEMPPMIKVLKIKKVLLKGTYANDLSSTNLNKRYGKIIIRSGKQYVTACKEPRDQNSGAINLPNADWYDDSWNTNTYCFVYAVALDGQIPISVTDNKAKLASGQVSTRIIKETSYTGLY